MSIRAVTVKEKITEWRDNPQKLLAFMLELIWEANIKPEQSLTWSTFEGKIIIADSLKRLNE